MERPCNWNIPKHGIFRSKTLESLTRETIQNSLDAVASPEDPVHVNFKEFKLSRDKIPDIDALGETLDQCYKVADKEEDQGARQELRTAINTVRKPEISILEISDYGTKGMQGPCQHGKPFFSYLKARGQSGGPIDRAGSHGIGKAAPLCVSNLRTIFVSSKWHDDEQDIDLGMIQGRSTLMSHCNDSGGQIAGVGFWGKTEHDDAITEEECRHAWLKREDVGTSVFVVAWNKNNKRDWKSFIIAWATINYFAAFYRKRLVLNVEDDEIDSTNIENVLSNERYAKLLDADKGRLSDARFFLDCLKDDDEIKQEETQLPHIGRSKLCLLPKEGAPRKIAIIRRNMLITDQLSDFWKAPPNRLQDFAGVFECLNPEGEAFIRAMEPPAHDDLSSDSLPIGEQGKGQSALKALAGKLKELTEKHVANETREAGEIDFLKDFFADEAGDGSVAQTLEDRDPSGRFLITPKPVKLPPPAPVNLTSEHDDGPEQDAPDDSSDGEAGGAGAGGRGGGDNPSDGPGYGPNDGGTGDQSRKPRPVPENIISLKNCRFVKISGRRARLLATPSADGRLSIGIYEVGADSDEDLNIVSSEAGHVEKGLVVLDVKKGGRISLAMTFDRAIVGGLKPIASTCRNGS